MSRVLLAMSGGVDSTAAALLLREQGYSLVGCTFYTRYTHDVSVKSAVQLAQSLDIEHYVFDYDKLFHREVIRYFTSEYMAGRTPNPCVVCNRTIKFGQLLEEADRLGCDYIATGHYARAREGFLYRAKDENKDQTYFLWQLSEAQIKRTIFPLGDYTKSEVRAYLESHGLRELAHHNESQDICFIADDYRQFLAQQSIVSLSGNYIDAEGHILGRHQGYTNYTIGQRKGLGVALGYPAFVTQLNPATNEVTLGQHDELYTNDVHLRDIVFRGDEQKPVLAQIRYRSHPQQAMLVESSLQFELPVWAVTPGQSAVIYQNNRLVGGGIIA